VVCLWAVQVDRCFARCWWVLVGSGEASVLGEFSFHLFLLYFLFYFFFFDRWHFGGKGNLDGRLEYSFKNDGIIEVCRYKKLYGMEPGILS
jgi:hypothetical protein